MKPTRLFDYIAKQFDDGPLLRFIGSREGDEWKFYVLQML
jgi:hypothetical protein